MVLYYGSANRDASVFDAPDRLDVTRTPNHHVVRRDRRTPALGAQLARVEIDAMLREVLLRMPDLEFSGTPEWLASNFISGPRAMPVRFMPGKRSSAA